MAMDILVSTGPPGHLRVTQSMVEDCVWNPLIPAKFIFPDFQMDHFQRARMKMYWWVPWTMDSSGTSSGKTLVQVAYTWMRALILSHLGAPHHVLVYYPTFANGKEVYWSQFNSSILGQSRVMRAHLGQMVLDDEDDGRRTKKGLQRGGGCFTAHFKNGAWVKMPSPNFRQDANSSAGYRAHTLFVDEWTQADELGAGIDDQLLERVTASNFNPGHPVWANHFKFSAHAETNAHPSWKRYRTFRREVEAGNPNYAEFGFSAYDWSDEVCANGRTFRQNYGDAYLAAARQKRRSEPPARYLSSVHGIWGQSSDALLEEEK